MNISNLVKRMDLRGAKATLAALPWMPRAILPHPEPRALSPARPTPLLRASRFALLALALCGALLLMATPASAQETVVTLVSNTGQTNSNNHGLASSFPSFSQAFTTGSNASGYTLDSIGIDFDTIADTSTAAAELTVTLNADDSGDPGDALCTLTDPATFSASGVHTFDAPSSGTTCPTLAASTTYFVVVTLVNSAGTSVMVETLLGGSEDSGGAAGWSLADTGAFFILSASRWTSSSNALMIEVKGFNAVATPGVTVSESAIAVTEGGATGTYTVVLDTAPTGDVTIAVTETSDDISLSATTLTFGTANWSNAQTVTVTAVDDSSTEAEETVTITHSVSASADTTDYPTTLTVDSVSVTVTDNDDATPPGAPVLTAAAKNESIELTWTIADHGTSDITRFDYRIKQTTGGTYPATWTDTGAAALNTGGSATIGSLTNGTQYTVQVRGVNSEGEGAGSNEPTATPDAPPAITSVAITSDPGTDKTYIIDEEIEFTLTFDKDLTLGGTNPNHLSKPYIIYRMESHSNDPQVDDPEANCVIGTDTKTAVCTDDVDEGNYDTDGIHVPTGQLNYANPSVRGFYGPLGQLVLGVHPAIAVDANHKVDGVKPTLSSADASSDLTKVVLTFSEAIGMVDNTKITVKKGGTDQTTTGAAIDSTNSTKVEITLMTAFLSTDTNITVELAADAVTDVPGNGIDAVSSMAVSLVDNTAPTLTTASTVSNTEVLLTYNEPLDPDSIPAASAFTVWANANEVWSATLTVRDTGSGFLGCNSNPSAPFGDECNTSSNLTANAFSYDGADYEIRIIELKAGTLAFETNLFLTPPTVRDLTLNVGATSLAFADASHIEGVGVIWTNTGLTWSENDQIALSIGGGTARTVSAATPSGTSVLLALSPAFRPGDALTVSYTVPETNPIQDIAGNDAAALADQAVSNTLAATAPEAVASLSAAINTSTFGEVALQWDGGTWANGSAITRHEVRYGDHTPIWSATLTVKDLGSNFLGCDSTLANKRCEPGELLTDGAFSYDSVDYLIDAIDLIGGQLRLITNTSSINAAALADLTLHVGALSFPFADATHSTGNLTWTGTGLSWSEDDTVPLAIRAVSPWTEVPDSAPGEANETSHTLEGLDPGEEYTFEVRAVNGVGGGGEASDTLTLLAPEWSFTLRDSGGNDVTELTEGGDPATATVTITNAGQATFGADQTITLEWGDVTLEDSRIQGAGNTSTITILAGASSGSLDLSAPDNDPNPVYIPGTADLTATWEDAVIGTIMDLRRIEDESPPAARITDAPESVNEGDTIDIDIEFSVRYPDFTAVKFTITDDDSALSGTLPTQVFLPPSDLDDTVTLTAAENTVQNDGARTVTFTLETNPDFPYTLGTPKTVTIIVRDDDTPPLAVGNLRAQAGNTEATLRWDAPPAPTPDHGQPILHYEYRVKVGTGSFGSWAMVPNSDGTTTSHKFTGLTNGTEYTYEVRAENVAGDGAEDEAMVTPIEGVAVSFAVAALSVDEGEEIEVTVTLAEAPTPGTTVTVPLVATRGAGLEADEYSDLSGGSVIFGSGDVSQSFTVTTVEDTADEPDAVLTLTFGPLPAGYIVGTHAELALTVVDDDHPIVSATFDRATATVSEGGTVAVTVNLSQAPEREVVLPLVATRGANFAADEVEGVPASVTIAADATQAGFTVTFADDAEEEGNETLTLIFGPRPAGVTSGANPQLVLTVTDDDGPPLAPDVSTQTGDGYVTLSWDPVANDSPILRYEVRVDGGAWQSVGLETSYQYEDLENGRAYVFEVRAVNAHGNGDEASAPGTPTARLTGIPKAVQVLQVKATDSGRAELSWTRPANGTDRVTANSAAATFAQIQGYRIEVCRTVCGEEANWYAVVANTGRFEHSYVHQVLAPGVIRENHYRVQAININGKTGPWSNVATLDRTVVENFRLQTPDDSTLWVRFRVLNPDGNKLYVRYTNTGTGSMGNAEPYRLTKKGDVKLDLTGLEADSWYRVDIDFSADFDSARRQSRWYGTAKAGHTPLTSPYAVDALDAQVFAGGAWRDASDTALYVRMGGTGKYRVRLKPCQGIHDVIVHRIQAPAGRLRASPMETDPVLFTNLNCESEFDDWRRDEHGEPLTMDQVYDMTNFPDRAKDFIPIYAGTPNNWHEVTVTARALEDYPHDVRADALLSAPFAVVYNHEVWKEVNTSSSYLVSEGTGLVRVLVDRPADAVLPVPGGVTIGSDRVMTWDAVSGATGYLVEWRHGPQYSDRANQNRSLQTATSVTLPPGASGRGPVTARVRAYSSSGVSAWSPERTWDSRAPTLNVLDTAVNEADGSVGFLVTLDPAATGIVTVQYTTVDATAVAPADYTATSGTLTFAPGDTRKQTALVLIVNDGEEDSGETFRLVLSNPTGSDANNGAAVLGDAEAVATILNSEREAAELTGFTLVDAGTNGDLMALADGSIVRLGELLASSYGIRAEMSPGAAPGSVRLELSGAKTAAVTDDAAPWSLYGDGAGRINGASLPPGSYTLTATAYADSGGRGDERGSLEVSFTVAAGALGVTTPGPFTVAEGKTAVAQLAASDTGTGGEAVWSIPAGAAGGADGAAFAVTSEGVLSLVAAKDFEAPDDADGDGTYEVSVSVTAGTQTATAALSVTLADVDEPTLAVTTAGPFTVAEGETAVAALAASDTGTGATAVWSIPAGAESGADGAAFAVTSEGVLSLVAAKDFEAPDDADGDGTYEVSVAVAVPASSMAGAQSATAALLVTLSDVNEAPVAQASASAARVREGARVTLDGSASTDPDAGDTLTYLWTQADDGAPRVTLSDASAEQPAFTSPSDLAAETELAFTLRVTDADGLYAEDTLSVAVTLISEVSISAASNYAAEGDEAVFRLTRAGSALRALTVPVTVEETGAMLGTGVPAGATFAAGVREAELRVPTLADAVLENDSQVTVRLGSGPGWQLAPGAASASLTVLDDDVAPSVSVADVTIWSADMTVVEYGPRSIGAGTADLFSNQMGRAGLRAKWLWYDPVTRKLKLGFDDSLDDAELLTLHMGGVSLGFPDGTGGNSSFSLENVDLDWTDGETLAVRVSKPSAAAVSTDATLASLTVDGATLSPAFDAGVLVYRAAGAGAGTVTVAATASDAGAAVAYGPGEDADTALADHQVAVPDEGEALVEVTVTAADGTVRRYRVVVAPTAAESNTAPTGAPTISGTPQVGETLTADTSAIADRDGLANVSYSYQWIRSDNGADTDIAGETDSTYTLVLADLGKTIKVKVTFTDDADNDETLTSEATVAATATVPSAPQSMTVTSGSQTQELDVSWQAPSSNGGSAVTGYKVQWKESTDSWDTADDVSEATETGTTHTITSLTGGVEYAVRVIATNVAGDSPASTEARATPADSPASGEEGTETGESDSTAAWTASLTVGVSGSGSEAVWGYSWFLDGMGTLDKRTYNEGDQTIEVMAILMSNGFVAFNVRPHPSVDFVLTVDGTEFASADASEVKSQMLISYVWATTLDWAEDDRVALSLTLKDTDSAEQSEPAENTPAIGLPTISGTPQVDETLTADTSAISDEDGLSNVSYQYQWLRDDADIAGQTNSTYRLVSADQDKTIKVRVTFRDDADNAEFLTSMATTAVAAQPTPAVLLTASFANVPADHNGDNFTFQLNFSENVNAGYARIRDHAFTVDGATIANAYRQTQGSNQGWNVEVNPTGNGEPSASPCRKPPTATPAAQSARMTSRKLSHPTSATVAGPPAISVSDATVQEAEGAVLVFTATLSHASSRTVTVDYATSDGTAVAGSDYTAASGALTFNAGDTSQTVQVTVLTDSEDESQETLTLTLSNPSQATLDDATGTGAIENGESSSGTQEDPPAEDPPVVLLTASLDNMPATHNGTAFTFDLTFSEEFGLSYVTLKTHAFNVTGGTVENAQRTDKPSNISWRITVKPNGNGDVTLVLPVTTDCNAEGAICTADGRKLSNRLEFTVSGPGQ